MSEKERWKQYLEDFWEEDPHEPFLPNGLWMQYTWPTHRIGFVEDDYVNLKLAGYDATEYKKRFWAPDHIRLSPDLAQAKREAWVHWLGHQHVTNSDGEAPTGYVISDERGFHEVLFKVGEALQ